jgi:phosphoribosylformylglycinamidine cyclo-ligase
MGKGLTYGQAGVSIDAGDALVDRIAPLAKATYTPRVIGGIGGFGGLFALDYEKKLFRKGYRQPVLVASTDGVGTKLDVARLAGKHDTVGIDLVAMSVNDILVCGAEPLFFLDYFVTGRLDVDVATDVVAGIAHGCEMAECALLGGETAEHPGTFPTGEYDLAGFAVGVVEKSKIIDGKTVEPGDVVLGLASSGLHSNGFSLTRKIVFDVAGLKIADTIPGLGRTVAEELLTPTRIYVQSVRFASAAYKVKKVIKAMAHITGGGLTENVPRVVPNGVSVEITKGSWPVPPIFDFLEKTGEVDPDEMYRVYNMGIGFVMIVAKYYAEAVAARLQKAGETVYRIGRTVSAPGPSKVLFKSPK